MKNTLVFWHLSPPSATHSYLNLALLHSFQTKLSGDEWSPPKQRTGIKVRVGGGCFGCKCVCVYVCPPGWVSIAPWQCDKLIRMFSMSLNNVLSPCRVYVIN